MADGETRFAAMLIRDGAADEALVHLRAAQAIRAADSQEDLETAEILVNREVKAPESR